MTALRPAAAADAAAISQLIEAAFDSSEAEPVARLATGLLVQPADPAGFSLIAEHADATPATCVGAVGFSPLTTAGTLGLRLAILAPLAVAPDQQRRGIGQQLVTAGLARLRAAEVAAVLVYGDPAYYERFGFTRAVGACVAPPYPLRMPFGWLGLVLEERSSLPPITSTTCVAALQYPDLW